MAKSPTHEAQLVEALSTTVYDPMAFVRFAFPWGEPGDLANETGPDTWQRVLGNELGRQVAAGNSVRMATSTGHGTGKSTLVSWLILWFMSTRPDPQIIVMANTREQLLKKTFRELAVWHKRAINKHWFTWTATKFYHNDHPETWFANAASWSKDHTEAAAGTHAKYVMCIFDEACHDDKTDVLTDQGWKRFAALDGSEQLLTMDPATGRAFYERPTRLYQSPYDGPMHRYERRGASFCVTPRHKMLEQRYSASPKGSTYTEWKLTPIEEIANREFYIQKTIRAWEGERRATYVIPAASSARKVWAEVEVPMDEWATFLGWYFSEGGLGFAPNGRAHVVTVSQKDPRVLSTLARMVNGWGLPAKVYTSPTTPQLHIVHGGLAALLHSYGRGCLVKRIPDEIRNATPDQQRLFLGAMRDGDGYWKSETRQIIYTSNEGLAGDVQEIALKAGYNCTVCRRPLTGTRATFATHTATSTCDGFVVTLSVSTPRALVRQNNTDIIHYTGTVYCAEVPSHHVLLTRRNGTAMWSGNSGIDDTVWETLEGAQTTQATIWLAFGNPTRNTGRFRECFGRYKHRWTTYKVDSRQAKMTNKAQLQEWVDDYGEDSDFVRVRVRGEFPRAGSTQFIDLETVEKAMKRRVVDQPNAPRVLSVDVARFGDDQSVLCRRLGRKLLPLETFRGLDTMQVAARTAQAIDEWHPDAVFVDGTGIGAGVVDRLRSLGYVVFDVLGSARADDPQKYANKRAECWGRMKEWLNAECELPPDDGLRDALIGVEYGYNAGMAIQLEKKSDMKARGLASPDEADALSLGFAEPVRYDRVVELPEGLVLPAYNHKRIQRRHDLNWRVV